VNLSLPFFDPVTADDGAPSQPRDGGGTALAPAPAPGEVGAAVASGLAGGSADPPAAAPWSPVLDLAQHPAVWRASQIGGLARPVTTSGFAALDAQLPGGGWPHGVLTELLLPEPGVGELRLLAPALAAVAAARAAGAAGATPADGRCVMLFDPPALLNAWALVQCGLASRHWLVVQGRAVPGRAGPAGAIAPGAPRGANRLAPLLPSADLLWALEQSLKSGHVGAVLAWLPLNLRADALRRLQLAAQSHDGPVFVFRDALARSQPSPAPLRLLLQPAGIDGLSVRLLKRRGPALAQPLRLALPPVLAPHQQAQAEARQRSLAPAPAGMPVRPHSTP
jgi:protein ImuA